jgi:hypothetical protein
MTSLKTRDDYLQVNPVLKFRAHVVHDFSDDPSLDVSNRVSVLPNRQGTPGSLDDTVEFWSTMDIDLPMYRVPATPKVEISSYCFG